MRQLLSTSKYDNQIVFSNNNNIKGFLFNNRVGSKRIILGCYSCEFLCRSPCRSIQALVFRSFFYLFIPKKGSTSSSQKNCSSRPEEAGMTPWHSKFLLKTKKINSSKTPRLSVTRNIGDTTFCAIIGVSNLCILCTKLFRVRSELEKIYSN